MTIVGLGNPGRQYALTRHNVGFMVVERVASRVGVTLRKPLFRQYRIAHLVHGEQDVTLLEPLTFMNRSGVAVRSLIRDPEAVARDVVVVCDTLDLPVGAIRLRQGGSSAGHRGLRSIIEETGTDTFIRCYIGIGRPATKDLVIDYVLGEFDGDCREQIAETVDRAAEAVLSLAVKPLQEVVNDVNGRQTRSGGN
ncbi:MAG TPA: aminoacyl-tRNA hydrolase [Spirochaetia bacterium]|nr:aminoacyl-tRNA hydrolase [Spirochaetia bacterium]